MIKSRGPKDMMWDEMPGGKPSRDIDLPEGTPKFWTCANCRSVEPIASITLIGKMPLCQECCGGGIKAAVPAGGIEEIVERILERNRAVKGDSASARAKRKKRHPKERQIRH